MGEYVLQVRPKQRTAKLVRLKPGASSRPGFNPQSVDNLTIEQDSVPGSGTPNTVELNTIDADGDGDVFAYDVDCPNKGINAPVFCATVELGNFYTRSLNNAFVQVTAITDADGDALDGHSSSNSDGVPIWLNDPGLGLWKYTGPGVTAPGVVGASPGVIGPTGMSNIAPRVWEFDYPDDQEANIALRVIATLSYNDYTYQNSKPLPLPPPPPFLNACEFSTGTITTDDPIDESSAATIPFPFTFYGTQATTMVHFTRNGVVTFGATLPPPVSNTPGTFVNANSLPENPIGTSVSPGLFVFWDQLDYNTPNNNKLPSSICYGTSGTAPNRQFVITWLNMRGFNDPVDTMNLTFSAILSEGTDAVDFQYGSMMGTAGNDVNVYPVSPLVTYARRANGKKAVVGLQGGGIATPFPAVRGGQDTSTGRRVSFTPRP